MDFAYVNFTCIWTCLSYQMKYYIFPIVKKVPFEIMG